MSESNYTDNRFFYITEPSLFLEKEIQNALVIPNAKLDLNKKDANSKKTIDLSQPNLDNDNKAIFELSNKNSKLFLNNCSTLFCISLASFLAFLGK